MTDQWSKGWGEAHREHGINHSIKFRMETVKGRSVSLYALFRLFNRKGPFVFAFLLEPIPGIQLGRNAHSILLESVKVMVSCSMNKSSLL
jgi:hypothetical protein